MGRGVITKVPRCIRYELSGTLAGITGPGRRKVTWLEITHLGPEEDLSVLHNFPDLDVLMLGGLTGTNLAPLAGLSPRYLSLGGSDEVDLGVLNQMQGLQQLAIGHMRTLTTPPLRLPWLRQLELSVWDRHYDGAFIPKVVDAIDWAACDSLWSLVLEVGGLDEIRPVEVDLGFLRQLPALKRLWVRKGVWHRGAGPSPLQPPFDGLPTSLQDIQIDAWEPQAVRPALIKHLGGPDTISVPQRYAYEEPEPPWTITEYDGQFLVYGRLYENEDLDDPNEYDACRRAKTRLRKADPALLRRLDIDPESAGTGITAHSREDLEQALRILGLKD